MGLDLRLLPYDHNNAHFAFSHTVLSCARQYELFDLIKEVEERRGREVIDQFTSFLSRDEKFEESHYGVTTETPYGSPLYEIEVVDLMAFRETANLSPRNRAVWAYLAELPKRTKVALYWH